MQKQQKNQARPGPKGSTSRTAQQESVVFPDVVSSDALGIYSDEELFGRLRRVEGDLQKVVDAHLDLDLRPWERELAYAQRELQIRRERRETHERYRRQLEKEFAEAEYGLPSADLDNTRFLRLAGVIN